MSLFDGLSTPKWLSNEEVWNKPQEHSAGDLFLAGLAKGMQASKDAKGDPSPPPAWLSPWVDPKDKQMALAKHQQQMQMTKFGGIADAMKDLKTPQERVDVMSQNPIWMMDPQTAGPMQKFFQDQAGIIKAGATSTSARLSLQDNANFLKRLTALDPQDRAALKEMKPGADGPSAEQWGALDAAEQAAAIRKTTAAADAEKAAKGRGDVETTTLDAKGNVVRKFAPAKQTGGGEWITKDLDGGKALIYNSKGTTGHIVQSGNAPKPVTLNELTAFIKTLPSDDPDISRLKAMEKSMALGQSSGSGGGTAPLDLPGSKSALVKGQTYKTAKGNAVWDGAQFTQP